MKRILSLLMIMALCFSITACGSKSDAGANDVDDAKESAAPEATVSESLTLKEALEKENPQIWFITKELAGRNTKAGNILVFKDNTLAWYEINKINEYEEVESLGTLEDYYSLSTEDAIALAEKKYKEVYESYYGKLDEIAAEIEGGSMDDFFEDRYPEEQKQFFYETRDAIKAAGIPVVKPYEYRLLAKLDDTGNGTKVMAGDITLGQNGFGMPIYSDSGKHCALPFR